MKLESVLEMKLVEIFHFFTKKNWGTIWHCNTRRFGCHKIEISVELLTFTKVIGRSVLIYLRYKPLGRLSLERVFC